MVDWNSPKEFSDDSIAFVWFLHVLLGIYSWEFVSTLKFDWHYVIRKKQFRWPMAFYFANRYCLLMTLVTVMIAVNITTPISCPALFVIVQLCGQASIGFACINFALRTIPLWEGHKWVPTLLTVITVGHWSLILQAGAVGSTSHGTAGCYAPNTNVAVQTAMFVYATAFDLVLLTLIMIKHPFGGYPTFTKVLEHDSFLNILTALVLNCLAAIFMHLNLNVVMDSIFIFPSVVLSTIAATRCIRGLIQGPQEPSPQFFGENSTVRFCKDTFADDTFTESVLPKSISEVSHIRVETTVEDVVSERTKAADEESQVLPREPYSH